MRYNEILMIFRKNPRAVAYQKALSIEPIALSFFLSCPKKGLQKLKI